MIPCCVLWSTGLLGSMRLSSRMMFGCSGESRLKHGFELAVKEPNVLVSDRRSLLGDIAHPSCWRVLTGVPMDGIQIESLIEGDPITCY